MAPVTRRSVSNTGVAKSAKSVTRKPRASRLETSDSWELLERQQSDLRDIEHEQEAHDRSLATMPSASVEDAVESFRDMADRMGKEVETFAETLDRFFEDLPEHEDRYEAALDLVMEFKNIADTAVTDLKKTHERERAEQLRKEWSEQANISTMSTALRSAGRSTGGPLDARRAEQVKELRQYQEEADTWELFRIMLELHYNPNKPKILEEKEEKLARMNKPHRYTPEADLYERFLIDDDVAKERSLIKTWLEQTADHQKSDLDGIMKELEAKSGTGAGLWSRGWMHSREKIKAEKRLRTWPTPDSSPLPQVRTSDSTELLVTSMDPDAPTRQDRALEKQDAFFERAVWIACWEMLRRGTPWSDVCDWCESHKEGWRAVAIGMAGVDSTSASNAGWRRMCFLASQSNSASEYEAAVYGLLGGNVKAMQKISKTIDDHLYAYFSTTLTRQFDQYVATHFPERVPKALAKQSSVDEGISDPQQAQQTITELIYGLRKRSTTQRESVAPIKLIQSYLLANEADSLVNTLGVAISDTDSLRGDRETLITRVRELTGKEQTWPEAEVVCNPKTLRIAAHICIVLQVLRESGDERLDSDDQEVEDNVLVAYIQALRAAGKRDLTPLYASRLQKPRHVVALARVLQDVTERQEREYMIGLMEDKKLDVEKILWEQLDYLLQPLSNVPEDTRKFSILETCEHSELYPGQRIKLGALPDNITPEEDAVVRALRWYLQMPEHWNATFTALTRAFRTCLITGRFACARLIVETFPYDVVSQTKSYQVIGRSVNFMSEDLSRPADKRQAAVWNGMHKNSRVYYELEEVMAAFEALAHWRSEEHNYVSKVPRPASVPASLKRAFEAVTIVIKPILEQPNFLVEAMTETEAAELEIIRSTYIPEAILAYNSVLHGAGSLITRDILVKSMDLATIVAKEDHGLSEAFVAGGRMRELVASFASTSQNMLVIKSKGKPWKPKKDREGKDGPGIWEIGPQQNGGIIQSMPVGG